jgi:hypothetical protein
MHLAAGWDTHQYMGNLDARHVPHDTFNVPGRLTEPMLLQL